MLKTKNKRNNKLLKFIFGKYGKNSVQDTFPFSTITKDGLMILENNFYSKMIEYEDINYKLSHDEDKNKILEKYFSLLNMFDESVDIQLCFINETNSKEYFEEKVLNKLNGDKLDIYKQELNETMQTQLLNVNAVLRRKFIVITLQEKDLMLARKKIQITENKILNKLKLIGSRTKVINGNERINLLKNLLNKKEIKKDIKINWKDFKESQISIKDYISPQSLNFSNDSMIKVNNRFYQICKVELDATELEDNFLEKLIEFDYNLLISISFQTVNKQKATKKVKNILSDLEKTKRTYQKNNLESGADMDLLPPDLKLNLEETKELLEDIERNDEKFFQTTFTILFEASTIKKLNEIYFNIKSVCEEYNCNFIKLYNNQEQGLISTLPLGYNELRDKRGLTTSSLGILVPFTTQELFQNSKTSLYYGYNSISSNILYFDRKNLQAPNGLILGFTGSGKSFKAKREIIEVFFRTEDEIVIADPEREYNVLVRELGGQVIELSATSTNYINPFDIDIENITSNIIKEKSLFIISIIEQIIAGVHGLTGTEISIIDRCVIAIYNKFLQNPTIQEMPTFQDFYDLLCKQEDMEAKDIATRLEIYVTGSMNVFNNRTNINLNNRLIAFDINSLTGVLKSLGLLILQEFMWNKVSKNRKEKKNTWYFIDEIHVLFKDEKTSEYMIDFWKRFRKYGGIPTGITQNVTDLLLSPQIANIFKNSDFIVMLTQSNDDKKILAKELQISEEQLSYITNAEPGSGLIYYEGKIVPFKDTLRTDTKLYKLISTKLKENEIN
ncbi:VirB4-like conjugal transfer ATPase, CD1110 family [Helcococcus bovis]|uniref:VirB4-like conjugal transfer ATPase, CD1110 family n=1 Tax=Helcococcus bovis TaxID=3153252 RepID=UPI0038B8AF88